MKYVVIIVVVLLLLWLLRGKRRADPPPSRGTAGGTDPKPQDMVACAECGVHLPHSEALPGRGGVFCGEAHRLEYERRHAGS